MELGYCDNLIMSILPKFICLILSVFFQCRAGSTVDYEYFTKLDFFGF